MGFIKIIIRVLFVCFGVYSIFSCLRALTMIMLNFSNLLTLFFGTYLILFALFFDVMIKHSKTGLLKHLRVSLFSLTFLFVIGFLVFCLILKLYNAKPADKNADAIIILGAGIIGDRPTSTLSARLYVGAEYLKQNPNTIAIVSGGQGKDEIVSEASVMQKYLLDSEIDDARIIMEDKSTSTKENFKLSKQILDEYFGGKHYTVLFVTNDFHVLRSLSIAESYGMDAGAISFKSPETMVLVYNFREYLAFMWYIVSSIV